MLLVNSEPSTMRIGEAGFEQLANVVRFPAPDFVPLTQFSLGKSIFLPKGDVDQNVTYGESRKNRDKYALFSPNSLLTLHHINVLKKGKTSTSFLSPSWHATCVVASNLRSQEFGCIMYAVGEYSIV